MKRILFCGSYLQKEESIRIKNPQEASNNFQHEFISKLKKYCAVDVLSYICFDLEDENRTKRALADAGIYSVIKSNVITTYKEYYKLFSTLIKNKPDKVIVYNMNYMYSFVWMICKIHKIKCSLIIADYTPYIEEKTLGGKIKAIICGVQLNCFPEHIILSPELYKKMKRKNSILLQGGVNPKKYEDFEISRIRDKVHIVFSGALEYSTGIDQFLKAIEKISDQNIHISISGNGSLRNLVEKEAMNDNRIEYVGFLSEAEYLNMLKSANILVNPRNMDLLQSKNNFPSKILEYLATGRPIISTQFSGFEYFENHIIFYSGNYEELEAAIKNIVENYEEISNKMFSSNRDFVKQFYWDEQIKRVIC